MSLFSGGLELLTSFIQCLGGLVEFLLSSLSVGIFRSLGGFLGSLGGFLGSLLEGLLIAGLGILAFLLGLGNSFLGELLGSLSDFLGGLLGFCGVVVLGLLGQFLGGLGGLLRSLGGLGGLGGLSGFLSCFGCLLGSLLESLLVALASWPFFWASGMAFSASSLAASAIS